MSDEMNALIRAARGNVISGSTKGADMDAAIRHAAGRGPAPGQPQEGNDQATAEQLQAARRAGLPDSAAHRVTGDDLNEDARALAAAVVAAGGELVPAPSFDGGARGTEPAPQPVSMNSLLRGYRMGQKQNIYAEALNYQRAEDFAKRGLA